MEGRATIRVMGPSQPTEEDSEASEDRLSEVSSTAVDIPNEIPGTEVAKAQVISIMQRSKIQRRMKRISRRTTRTIIAHAQAVERPTHELDAKKTLAFDGQQNDVESLENEVEPTEDDEILDAGSSDDYVAFDDGFSEPSASDFEDFLQSLDIGVESLSLDDSLHLNDLPNEAEQGSSEQKQKRGTEEVESDPSTFTIRVIPPSDASSEVHPVDGAEMTLGRDFPQRRWHLMLFCRSSIAIFAW